MRSAKRERTFLFTRLFDSTLLLTTNTAFRQRATSRYAPRLRLPEATNAIPMPASVNDAGSGVGEILTNVERIPAARHRRRYVIVQESGDAVRQVQ